MLVPDGARPFAVGSEVHHVERLRARICHYAEIILQYVTSAYASLGALFQYGMSLRFRYAAVCLLICQMPACLYVLR